MQPLSKSSLWPYIRQAATMILLDGHDPDQGISSSDINHTVFGYARNVPNQGDSYPGKVLTELVHHLPC